jgi:hypothetical protein
MVKLEINNKRNYRKYSNTWRLNNSVLNWVIEEGGEKFIEANENKNTTHQKL